ncbi:site-specific integrase [Klebsiella michiganensis]|uniref:site-specific integrase n=1 Tax=Klebsiella michiganensis TaxID=1134687 RepID=UPI001BAB3294|nr:site-specific integrase [Klebsiella michiganensis]MBS0930627.1 site-specific integrase [Klebsiella michiganensis]
MNMPAGVELHGKGIRISFLYRGIRCREVLRGWTVSNSNIKKAGNLRALIISEIQQGKFDYAEHFPESKAIQKFTTTQMIRTYGELCGTYLTAKKLEVSAASYRGIVSRLETLRSVVGSNTYIADIQHSDLLNYRNQLLTGESVSPHSPWLNKTGRAVSTVNGLMNTLTAMLKLAQRSNFINHAPHDGIKMLKRSRKDPDPLLHDEYDAFIKVLAPAAKLLWIIAIHTGLRHGELAALAWEDIDLERGEIHVCRNKTNEGLFVPPKTDAGKRTVTLLKPALDALRLQFQRTGALRKTEITFHHREYGLTEQQHLRFVFIPDPRSRTKGTSFSKSSLGYSWDAGLKKAGIRSRRPYQSRHTFACWLLTAGANPSFIASQLGHENAKMVYEIYSKWIGGMDRNQVEMLNSTLPTVVSQGCPKDKVKKINFK